MISSASVSPEDIISYHEAWKSIQAENIHDNQIKMTSKFLDIDIILVIYHLIGSFWKKEKKIKKGEKLFADF